MIEERAMLLMILLDTPNRAIIFFLMKFAMALPVDLWSDMASTHLVKYSVAIKIHINLLKGGLTGPTKLSP